MTARSLSTPPSVSACAVRSESFSDSKEVTARQGRVWPQATTHRFAVAFLTRQLDNITSFPRRLAVVGNDLDRLEPRLRQFWLDGLAVADNEDETGGRGNDFGHRFLGLGKRRAFQVGQEGLEVIGRQTELGDLGKGGGDSGGRLKPLGIAPRLGGPSLVDLFGSDRPSLRERVELLEDLLKCRRCGVGSHGGRDAPDALAAAEVEGRAGPVGVAVILA